jgi:hypothetical protein
MSKRIRSPNYPALNLAESIDRLRLLYAREKTAHTTPDVAVRAWGYNSLNGASARVLSSLRQYGLLEDVGRDVKISHRGLTLLLEPEDSSEYHGAMLDASKEPVIFREILDEYPNGLPSEQGLISFLMRKRGFIEDAARKLNVVLRETMDLVGPVPSQHIPESVPADEQRVHPFVAAAQEVVTSAVQQQQQSPQKEAPPPARPESITMRYEYALSDGVATLSLQGESFTPEDIDDLYEWLQVIEKTLKRRVRHPATKPQPRDAHGPAAPEAEATGADT